MTTLDTEIVQIPSKEDLKTHITALDGIRGLAILLVLLVHLSEGFTLGSPVLNIAKNIAFAGWTGVDLFFVLSGFLITGILLDSKESDHYFRNFYARRTVRIFPIYYVTLFSIFVLLPGVLSVFHHLPDRILRIGQEFNQTRNYWGWYASYFVDILISWKGFMMPGHFWTLAVEEHFYLVWPLLVYFLRYRSLVLTCVAMIVGALLLRAVLIPFVSPVAIYVLTPCRMDGLALGALIALLLRTPGGLQRLKAAARLILPVTALIWAGLMLYLDGWWQYGGLAQTVGYSVSIFFYGSFLIMALSIKWITSLLSGKTLRFFGKYSYGIYIYHVFPIFYLRPFFSLGKFLHYSVIRAFVPDTASVLERKIYLLADGLLYVTVALSASVLMALLSWHLLEQPCLRLKRFFPMNRKAQQIASAQPAQEPQSSAHPVL